jgi:enterochelin esterase family protein
MPEMLRWLWRDYPRPDDPNDDSNRKLFAVENAPAQASPAPAK